jgi:hypothetical protein
MICPMIPDGDYIEAQKDQAIRIKGVIDPWESRILV